MNAHPAEADLFAQRARDYLAWCDRPHDGKSLAAFKREALQTLATVYSSALSLPSLDACEAPDPASLSSEKRAAIASNLKILPFQFYWVVFNPLDLYGDKEPVCADLIDDFQDIYSDLARGLWLYDEGHIEAAVFEWNQTFNVHWGRHAVSAMHALHSLDADKGVMLDR